MFDVICFGNTCEDIFLESSQFSKGAVLEFNNLESFKIGSKIEVENLEILPGGGGANTAVGLAKQDLSVSLVSRTGQDITGQQVLKGLYKNGVDTSMMQVDKTKSTGTSVVLVSKSGERTILIYRGAAANISSKLFISNNNIQSKWFYLTSLGGNFDLIENIIQTAHKNDIRIAYNPGGLEIEQNQKLIRILKNIDILFLNLRESAKLLDLSDANIGVITNKFQRISKNSIITDNENGAYYIDGKQILKINSLEIDVRDATGAGDAFGSGFLGSYIKGENPETCLKYGILNSISVIQKIGAQSGLLSNFSDNQNLKIEKLNYKKEDNGL